MTVELQSHADSETLSGPKLSSEAASGLSQLDFNRLFADIVDEYQKGDSGDADNIIEAAVCEFMRDPVGNMQRQIDCLMSKYYADRVIDGPGNSKIFATRNTGVPREIEDIYTVATDEDGTVVHRYSMNAATYPLFPRPYTLEVRDDGSDAVLYTDYVRSNDEAKISVEPSKFELLKAFEQLFRSSAAAVAAVELRTDKERHVIDDDVRTMLNAHIANVTDTHRIRDLTFELPR